MSIQQQYSLKTATAIVIANMIGTGVFVSIHFQAMGMNSGLAILLLWALGGIAALSGALCYIEIAGIFNRSGGEYEYLSKIYHPSIGFSAGICSLIVGFAAPLGASALVLGEYAQPLFGSAIASKYNALITVWLIVGIQMFGVKASAIAQNIFTVLKLCLVVFFIVSPFLIPEQTNSSISFLYNSNTVSNITTPTFWSNLTYVFLAYSGWNASTYIYDHLKNAKRTLPYSILIGTIMVTFLYLLLNFAFMKVCNFNALASGGEDVGNKIALQLFGTRWEMLFSGLFSLALIATLNSGLITAPRIAEILGKDYQKLSFFSAQNRYFAPYTALLFMGMMTTLMLIFSLKDLIQYIAISLSFFSLLVVIGLIYLRITKPYLERPFKAFGYPLTPVIFIGINGLMIYFTGINDVGKIIAALLTILIGILMYFVINNKKNVSSEKNKR